MSPAELVRDASPTGSDTPASPDPSGKEAGDNFPHREPGENSKEFGVEEWIWMLVMDLVSPSLDSCVGFVFWLFLEAVKMAPELKAPILST